MSQLNPDRFYQLVSGAETTPLKARNKLLSGMFWNIIEGWNTTSNIDFSIPFDDILEMVEKSPQFFADRMGASEAADAIFRCVRHKKAILPKRRLF